MNSKSLPDLFVAQAARYGLKTAFLVKKAGAYTSITWNDFKRLVQATSLWLHGQGVRKGDRVGILSENRPEWACTDLGILSAGAAVVPLYATASPKEIEHILTHSECSILFVSTKEQYDRISSIFQNLPSLKKIVLFDLPEKGANSALHLAQIQETAIAEHRDLDGRWLEISGQVGLDDLATIIYTSGTTGAPKGAMLTHGNFLANCYASKDALPINDRDILLSFLPLSHVFERMGGYYLSLLCGGVIAYAENMNTVPQNLVEVRPTIVCAVPRFFEKTYNQIMNTVQQAGSLRKKIFFWGIEIGKKAGRLRAENKPLPFFLGLQYGLAQKLVCSKISSKLGGKLRFFVSGGAPLGRELAEFFYAAGILILEGYGLTETSPVISVNRPEHFRFGSVGIPLNNVEVGISPEGEILARGPSIMKGYFKNEPATREAMEGGWFHTGDLGSIDSEGFLFITGRKKDIIVNSGGKKISPQNIENAILLEPVVNQIVIIGDRRNFLTALIVPNLEEARRVLMERGLNLPERRDDLVCHPAVHQLIRERIEVRTQDLAPYEKIKYFTLFAREWTQEQGEMTLTLKIKRRVIGERYQEVIDRMYQETQGRTDGDRDRIFYVI